MTTTGRKRIMQLTHMNRRHVLQSSLLKI